MSRFLFVMVEGGGNVPPQLGVAGRLRARGHEVRVLADRAVEPEARSLGLEWVPFQHAPHHNVRNPELDRMRDFEARNRTDALRRMALGVSFEPAALYARDMRDAMANFEPDVAAIDCLLFGAAIAAEATTLPTALLMHTVYFPPVPGAPPYGLGLRPAKRAPRRWIHAWIQRQSSAWFDRLGLAAVNAVRREHGLTEITRVADQLQRCERLLVMTSAGFDFVSAGPLPSNVRYVGPGLDDPAWSRSDAGGAAATPSAAARYAPPGGEPLVVVGLGSTFQNQHALTQRVIDALAELPVRGLVTLGEVFEPESFRTPDNVRVVRAAPHAEIFPEADVVVTHGGHGTVMKALSCGVPQLCIPLGRDQGDNAARLEHAGAGERLPPGAGTSRIRGSLRRLLEQPTYRGAARRLAEEIAQYERVDAAVAELEALHVASSSAQPAPAA